tara:strand:+ start:8464 stop:8802 length:339 start_codon:yes stop_codon:yes gene_type:complete
MELKQKYTEDEFELDDYFIYQMKELRSSTAVKIAKVIDGIRDIRETHGDIDNISGYVNDNDDNPFFFMIDYFTEEDHPIVLIDIYEIDIDLYLDQISLDKHIKNNNELSKNS